MDEIFDVIIIGAGAAGLSAGIYSSRAKLSTLILNEGAVGGQMVLTEEIANYPGVESTKGYIIANIMKQQAKSFGCKIKSNIKVAKYSFNEEVKVVGVGNSALEEAVTLTKFASKVTIVNQFDKFQAFEHAIEEAKKNPKIDFIMESELRGFFGNEKLEKVSIEHLPTGKISELKTDGTFIFIGYQPNTEDLDGLISLNPRKEIIVDGDMKTDTNGIFAAGDCVVKKYRQVTTAVADGTIASLSVADY